MATVLDMREWGLHLADVVTRVRAGEEITIADGGEPVARLACRWTASGPRRSSGTSPAGCGWQTTSTRHCPTTYWRRSRSEAPPRHALQPKPPNGYFAGVPDPAVEVVSPDDSRREVAERVNMWLAHGTQVVWEADPQRMTTRIYRVGVPPQVLSADDEIVDEPLLPGFRLPLDKVFRLP